MSGEDDGRTEQDFELECHEVELKDALERLVAQVEETQDNSGRWPALESWCNYCTGGSTPLQFDRGLCAYHAAKRLLIKLRRLHRSEVRRGRS